MYLMRCESQYKYKIFRSELPNSFGVNLQKLSSLAFNLLILKELVRQKKATHKELADKLDVSDRTVLNYLTEKTKIDVDTIAKFASTLGVSVGYFFDDDCKEKGVSQTSNGNNNKLKQVVNGNVAELDRLRTENKLLKEKIKDKEEIINLLKSQK